MGFGNTCCLGIVIIFYIVNEVLIHIISISDHRQITACCDRPIFRWKDRYACEHEVLRFHIMFGHGEQCPVLLDGLVSLALYSELDLIGCRFHLIDHVDFLQGFLDGIGTFLTFNRMMSLKSCCIPRNSTKNNTRPLVIMAWPDLEQSYIKVILSSCHTERTLPQQEL